jgi:hypothetical protein
MSSAAARPGGQRVRSARTFLLPSSFLHNALVNLRAKVIVSQEIFMHELPVKPRKPEHGSDEEGRDDVCDASMDSFPASDPPPWMGMRIGGPPRRLASEASGRAD